MSTKCIHFRPCVSVTPRKPITTPSYTDISVTYTNRILPLYQKSLQHIQETLKLLSLTVHQLREGDFFNSKPNPWKNERNNSRCIRRKVPYPSAERRRPTDCRVHDDLVVRDVSVTRGHSGDGDKKRTKWELLPDVPPFLYPSHTWKEYGRTLRFLSLKTLLKLESHTLTRKTFDLISSQVRRLSKRRRPWKYFTDDIRSVTRSKCL